MASFVNLPSTSNTTLNAAVAPWLVDNYNQTTSAANVPQYMWDWNGKLYDTSAGGIKPQFEGEVLDQLKAVLNPAYKAPTQPVGSDGKPVQGALNLASGFLNQFKDLTPEQEANIKAQLGLIDTRQGAANTNYNDFMSQIASGKFDPNITPVANAQLPQNAPTYTDAAFRDAGAYQGYDAQTAQAAPDSVYKDFVARRSSPYQDVATTNNSQNFKNADLSQSNIDDFLKSQSASTSDYQGTEPYKNIGVSTSFLPQAIKSKESSLPPALQNVLGSVDLAGDYKGVSAASSNPFKGVSYNGANTALSDAPTNVNAVSAETALSDLIAGRQQQGVLDPTSTLAKILQGTADNPYLQQMNQANINQAMRGYDDAIQSLNQQTMPNIGSEAFANGQYGGSRQGIAQGLALQQMERNARDLGIAAMDSGNNLYGNAYESAQQRMATAAGELNSQALQNQQFNASNLNSNSQFNAQNANEMAKFNVQNMLQNQQFNASAMNANNALNANNQLQADQFNAQNAMQSSQFDTQNINDIAKFNAQNALQSRQFDAQNSNDMTKFNAQNANDLNLAMYQSNLQNSQFNTQNANEMNLAMYQSGVQNNQYNAGILNEAARFNAQNNLQNQQFNAQNALQNSQFNSSAQNAMTADKMNLYAQNQQFNTSAANQNSQFNAQNWLQNNQFMDTQANQMSQFNAQNNLQNQQFNAQQLNQVGLANAQNNLQNSQFNNSALNDIFKFNTGQQNQVGLQNAANNLQNNQWNAGAWNQNSQFNAQNNLQNQQYIYDKGADMSKFNANLGMTNNQQAMANSQILLGNQQAGLDAMGGLFNLQDQSYNQKNDLYAAPYNQYADAFNQYIASTYGGVSLGGSKTTSITPYQLPEKQKGGRGC